MKKIMSVCITLLLIMTSINNYKFVEASSSTQTTVTGNVEASIIKVSVPSNVLFSINPNAEGSELKFAGSKIAINNEGNAPVEVKIKTGEQNFTLIDSSSWKPINTSPEAFNWGELGSAESESYIALGLYVDGGEWKKIKRSKPLYVQQHNTSSSDIILGDIKSKSIAYMSLDCKHGMSFTKKRQCVYRIIWTFSLAD